MPPLYGISFQQRGGALRSLPCVRGGTARSAAQGLYLTETIFFFFSANSKLLQSLTRSRVGSLYRVSPLVCADIAKNVFPFSSGGGLFRRLSGFDFLQAGAYGMPPDGVGFLPANGSSCACGAVRQHPVEVAVFHKIFRCAGERKIAFSKVFEGVLGHFLQKVPQARPSLFRFSALAANHFGVLLCRLFGLVFTVKIVLFSGKVGG